MSTSHRPDLHPALSEQFAYLETIGRVTGRPHEIEIWFAGDAGADQLYLMAGGRERADWVRNLQHTPRVCVRIAGVWYSGTARVIEGEPGERRARELVCAKYMGYEPHSGADLPTGWCREALPVAIALD